MAKPTVPGSFAEMKPAPFRYVAARSLEQALALKAEHGDEARFLAGGQSLVPPMNFRLTQPAMLIDINPLHDLAGVRNGGAKVRILCDVAPERAVVGRKHHASPFPSIGQVCQMLELTQSLSTGAAGPTRRLPTGLSNAIANKSSPTNGDSTSISTRSHWLEYWKLAGKWRRKI